jgi:hypothetical protein
MTNLDIFNVFMTTAQNLIDTADFGKANEIVKSAAQFAKNNMTTAEATEAFPIMTDILVQIPANFIPSTWNTAE